MCEAFQHKNPKELGISQVSITNPDDIELYLITESQISFQRSTPEKIRSIFCYIKLDGERSILTEMNIKKGTYENVIDGMILIKPPDAQIEELILVD